MAGKRFMRPAGALVALGLAFGAGALEAQEVTMTFFVIPAGPTWGANQPAILISDEHCHQTAYAVGLGDRTWRAYLNGSAADGEGSQVARARIGSGPWHNYYGVMIAEDLDQLHSDASYLNQDTAITITGEAVSPDVLRVPTGSSLDGSDFSREGPYFCFGILE